MELSAWKYSCATVSMGDINTGTTSSRLVLRRKDDDIAAIKIIVMKSKEVKTGCNMAESFK
jgi:hypothetical protein